MSTATNMPSTPSQTPSVEYWSCVDRDHHPYDTVSAAMEDYLDGLEPSQWERLTLVMAYIECDDQEAAEPGEMCVEHDPSQDVLVNTWEWVTEHEPHWLKEADVKAWMDANKPLSEQSNEELLHGLPAFAKDCTFESLTREQTLRFMEYMRRQCSKQHPACYDTLLTTEWLPKLLNKLWEEEA